MVKEKKTLNKEGHQQQHITAEQQQINLRAGNWHLDQLARWFLKFVSGLQQLLSEMRHRRGLLFKKTPNKQPL
eukprot:m.290400 g.290400  ORF g.290400 m.290400 type:complete len:73 (+) comp19466_c1_seq4:1537-1755(+)